MCLVYQYSSESGRRFPSCGDAVLSHISPNKPAGAWQYPDFRDIHAHTPWHRRQKGIASACFPPEELKIRTLLLCGEQKAEVLTPALIHTQSAVPRVPLCRGALLPVLSHPPAPPAPRPPPLGSASLRTVSPPRAQAVTDTIRSTGKNVTAFVRSPSASLAGGERRTVPAREGSMSSSGNWRR